MKRFLLLPPVLACLAACQGTPTTPATSSAAPAPAPPKPEAANPAASPPEYVEWRTLTVNGKPPQELTTALLERQLGHPDSIAKGAVECGSRLENLNKLDGTRGDFWYYGRTLYEVSGTQAILSSFDVTTAQFQGKVGPLLLNRHTTLEEVRRFFPVSAQQAEVPPTGRPGQVISLPFYFKGVPEDGSLNLLFEKGRLQQVVFFSPC